MKKKIAVITGTRAEYGLLKNIMALIKGDADLELQLIVTGTHLEPAYGNTFKEIEQDGFWINEKIDISLSGSSGLSVAKSMGLATLGFSKAFDKLKPDLIVVLGDRFEILAAAQTAMIFKIPIAHIHGGEITEGAFDEAIRHSVTKMSHLHFVATENYKKRVIQLGEQPDKVFHFGAPGLDNVNNLKLRTREELEKELGILFKKKIFVVTFHPVTLEEGSPEKSLNELLMALDQFKETSLILTLPNADPQSKVIADGMLHYAKSRKHVYVTPSLGVRNYLSVVKIANVVVGNSSSGLIEAPFLKTPTVNIGIRQKGRMSGDSVIHCSDHSAEIIEAINKSLSNDFIEKTKAAQSIYGDGFSSPKIFEVIKNVDLKNIIIKSFYDLVDQ